MTPHLWVATYAQFSWVDIRTAGPVCLRCHEWRPCNDSLDGECPLVPPPIEKKYDLELKEEPDDIERPEESECLTDAERNR